MTGKSDRHGLACKYFLKTISSQKSFCLCTHERVNSLSDTCLQVLRCLTETLLCLFQSSKTLITLVSPSNFTRSAQSSGGAKLEEPEGRKRHRYTVSGRKVVGRRRELIASDVCRKTEPKQEKNTKNKKKTRKKTSSPSQKRSTLWADPDQEPVPNPDSSPSTRKLLTSRRHRIFAPQGPKLEEAWEG